jgi:hypothetical protein
MYSSGDLCESTVHNICSNRAIPIVNRNGHIIIVNTFNRNIKIVDYHHRFTLSITTLEFVLELNFIF